MAQELIQAGVKKLISDNEL